MGAAAEADESEYLEGVDVIAEYLRGKGLRNMTARRIYRLREAGWPIVRVPGIGVAARKSLLDAYLNGVFARGGH